MEGILARSTRGGTLILLSGIVLVALYILGEFVDRSAPGGLLALLVLGCLFCGIGIFLLTMNAGAYIHIDQGGIQARYHWFGRLTCSMEQVAFAQPQINALVILLKNGKRHMIVGVTNAAGLAYRIRKQIFSPETESPDSLREKLAQLQTARKKVVWWAIGGMGGMFAVIFLAAAVTGGRELEDFSARDWTVFWIMAGVELLVVVGDFWLAYRAGKTMLPIQQLQYRLHGAVIANQALPPGQMVSVYTDANCKGRIVLYGFPNSESVYYCVQSFGADDRLETVDTSVVYNGFDELEAAFSEFIDITRLWQ